MELDLLRLGALVLKTHYYVVYALKCEVHWRFNTDGMGFATTVIWYHAHKKTDTESNHLQNSRICGLDLIRLYTSFETQRRLTEIM